jgi:hypothetical protein
MLGVLLVDSFGVLQFYVKHDLRKNKIVVASTTSFLGINTKFEVLAPNL